MMGNCGERWLMGNVVDYVSCFLHQMAAMIPPAAIRLPV